MLLHLQRSVILAFVAKGWAYRMHRIIWVSLSAALISARLSGAAAAAYTEADFVVIEEMIEAGNWVNLRKYLIDNPQILVGDDQFTEELRKFMNNTESLYTALIFEPSMFPDMSRARAQSQTAEASPRPSLPTRNLPPAAAPDSTIY